MIDDPASVVLIGELQDAPGHVAVVADHIWRAWWWKPYGSTLADVEAALHGVMATQGFPFTLVATRDGQFVGTVTSIQTDIHQRPELGPCLAALWVEPAARGQGIAQQLIAAVLSRLASRGFRQVYLSAKAPAAPLLRGSGLVVDGKQSR